LPTGAYHGRIESLFFALKGSPEPSGTVMLDE
jgi:hypothetical protein